MVAVRPENEGAVIGDGSGVAAAAEYARGGDLECASIDGGGAGVGVVAGEGQRAGADFCKCQRPSESVI